MITDRQEKILNFLVKEYIENAEPVSSKLLKKSADLAVSEATIRNELQDLTEKGFVAQPHTSAGRVPTQKAYKYFAEKLEEERQKQFEDFIEQQIKFAYEEMEKEMKIMEELMDKLEQDNVFDILKILDDWHRKL